MVKSSIMFFLFLVSLCLGYKDKCRKPEGYNSVEEFIKLNPSTSPNVLGNRVNLTYAQDTYGASCIDGTVPVFYFRPGFGDGVNKFHVYFEGGGWCAGLAANFSWCQESCLYRSTTLLGSSINYPTMYNYDFDYMSTNSTVNPLAYNWNTIYVSYCDGFSYAGNNDTVSIVNGTKLHFRGFRNMNGVFQELIANYSFGSKTTDVIFSGCSAGGLTNYIHAEHVYNTYIKPYNIDNFMIMPDSGFFLEYQNSLGPNFVEAFEWIGIYGNITDSANKECLLNNKNNEYKCLFAQEVVKYNNVKTFAMQARYDAFQTGCVLGSTDATTINLWGDYFDDTFLGNYINLQYNKSYHNAFYDSCFHHCGEWQDIIINGKSVSDAQMETYYSKNQQVFYSQSGQYPCNTCCYPN